MSVTSHENACRTGGADLGIRVDDAAARRRAARAGRGGHLRALPVPEESRAAARAPGGQGVWSAHSALAHPSTLAHPSALAFPRTDGATALAPAPVPAPPAPFEVPFEAPGEPTVEIVEFVDLLAAPARAFVPAVPEVDLPAAPPAPVAPAGTPVYRLTRRGQAALVAAGFALAIGLGAITGTIISAFTPAGDTAVVTVQPGDSLWSIAGSLASPGADLRPVIDEITSLNDLTGSTITAGMTLVVPAP